MSLLRWMAGKEPPQPSEGNRMPPPTRVRSPVTGHTNGTRPSPRQWVIWSLFSPQGNVDGTAGGFLAGSFQTGHGRPSWPRGVPSRHSVRSRSRHAPEQVTTISGAWSPETNPRAAPGGGRSISGASGWRLVLERRMTTRSHMQHRWGRLESIRMAAAGEGFCGGPVGGLGPSRERHVPQKEVAPPVSVRRGHPA